MVYDSSDEAKAEGKEKRKQVYMIPTIISLITTSKPPFPSSPTDSDDDRCIMDVDNKWWVDVCARATAE